MAVVGSSLESHGYRAHPDRSTPDAVLEAGVPAGIASTALRWREL